jgi:transcriptional regulator with XRE-family HTH domain
MYETGKGGPLVAQVRRERKVTQASLARRLGTTQSAIARLESENSNPRLASVARALAALGHELQLSARPSAQLDEEQLARHLQMTPAERAAHHDAAYRNTRELVMAARAAA